MTNESIAALERLGVTVTPVNENWARALRLVKNLPPLSPVARHLLATITTPGDATSTREVAGWIEKDSLTTGKVLALANSAWYSRNTPILSVRQAVARLGLDPIRNLVLGMSMTGLSSRLPTPPGWSPSNFNRHCLATAVLCEIIANALAPEYMEHAFLAGLFHDLGRLIIVVLLNDDQEALHRLDRKEHASLEEVETELVGFSHSELSAFIVKSWNLPLAVENAVRFHESPANDVTRTASSAYSLSEFVHAADTFVDCRGFSISGDPIQDGAVPHLFEKLGLGSSDSPIYIQFRDELDIILKVL